MAKKIVAAVSAENLAMMAINDPSKERKDNEFCLWSQYMITKICSGRTKIAFFFFYSSLSKEAGSKCL